MDNEDRFENCMLNEHDVFNISLDKNQMLKILKIKITKILKRKPSLGPPSSGRSQTGEGHCFLLQTLPQRLRCLSVNLFAC